MAAQKTEKATRDSILEIITGADIPVRTYKITSFGAHGDGRKDCKPAFDKAMQKARQKGGAHIVVPAGIYIINGPIHLVDNVCLDLEEGAVLRFSPEPRYYLPAVKTSWEGTYLYNYSPLIYGYGLRHVSIIGKGVIDDKCALGIRITTESTSKKGVMARGISYAHTSSSYTVVRELPSKEYLLRMRLSGVSICLKARTSSAEPFVMMQNW